MDERPIMANEIKQQERRAKTRHPVNLRVWADPGGVKTVVDCRVTNISDDGAMVASVKGEELPDIFTIQVEPTKGFGEARVVWRARQSVGVRFSDG